MRSSSSHCEDHPEAVRSRFRPFVANMEERDTPDRIHGARQCLRHFPAWIPSLENPSIWPDFHHALSTEIRNALNTQLPSPYYARVEMRPEIGIVEEGENRHREFPSCQMYWSCSIHATSSIVKLGEETRFAPKREPMSQQVSR